MSQPHARLAVIPLLIGVIVAGSAAAFGTLELDPMWRAAAEGAIAGLVVYLAGFLRE